MPRPASLARRPSLARAARGCIRTSKWGAEGSSCAAVPQVARTVAGTAGCATARPRGGGTHHHAWRGRLLGRPRRVHSLVRHALSALAQGREGQSQYTHTVFKYWKRGGTQNTKQSKWGGTQNTIQIQMDVTVTVRANGGRNFENEREKWSDGTRTGRNLNGDSWRFVCILVSLVNFSGSLAATWSARVEYSSRLILMAQASRRGRGVCFWVCAALCCLTRAAYAQPKYANRLAAESALVADIFGESEEYVTHSRCRIPP